MIYVHTYTYNSNMHGLCTLEIKKNQGVFGFKDGCNLTHDFCFQAFTTEKSPKTKSQNGLDQGNMFVKWDFPEQKLATGPTTFTLVKLAGCKCLRVQPHQPKIWSWVEHHIQKYPTALLWLMSQSFDICTFRMYVVFFESPDCVHGPPDSTFHCRTRFCAILQIWTPNEIPILTSVIK